MTGDAGETLVGGIEAGGTKFVLGIGSAARGSLATARIATTAPDETIAAAAAFFRDHAARGGLAAIGVASFGPVSLDPAAADYGHLLATPKPGWAGIDLRGRIAAATGVAAAIETDVNAAALAEAHARGGLRDLAYVTVGTGIGVGLVVAGAPVHGRGHPEMGHLVPRRHPAHGAFAGICPFHGDCLEGLASGPAIAAAWGAPLDALPAGHDAHDAIADYLGQLCAALLLTTAPARIVMGGGVMTGGALLPAIRARAAARIGGYLPACDAKALEERIVAPACVEPPGLIGAYLIAESSIYAMPAPNLRLQKGAWASLRLRPTPSGRRRRRVTLSTSPSIANDVSVAGVPNPDLTACDREPIHVSGAIQPHGLLLIANAATRQVVAGAGDIEGRLTPLWLGRPIEALLAQTIDHLRETAGPAPLTLVPGRSEAFEATLHVSGDRLIVELEPAPEVARTAAEALTELDLAGAQFERAATLQSLCERAAPAFRRVTGFDRVMIYRFLDDGAGKVLAEDRDPMLPSFLNHHFPASDIPKQARLLYIRNRVRVIPDIAYAPSPIRPDGEAGLDLSDVTLRSVSPIHLQYMRNMGVRASASISIVKDGLLWGLVACHHATPRTLPYETRAICQTMAGELARYIRSKEEAETFRERIRLRGAEDALFARIDSALPVERMLADYGDELRGILSADGFAVIQGQAIATSGLCPPDAALTELAAWLGPRSLAEAYATQRLSGHFAPAEAYRDVASGVLAITVPGDVPILFLWFRAEERTVVEWAGNPHKDGDGDPEAALTPRASFEAWSEEVWGCARRWTRGETDSATRIRRMLVELRQSRRLRELNRELSATIADKEALIQQKDHLIREVNHRVQNSLQLVQSFLALQARSEGEGALSDSLEEAQRRISAVALVHRRLYQADRVETVDLSRYLEELLAEMRTAMGEEWARKLSLNLAPVLISADRAINVGLVLTELVINANKYAYGGDCGPIEISIEQYRQQFRLIVADQGRGKPAAAGGREGFGTRMMNAMVARLGGEIEQHDNRPGLRVIVSAPID